MRVTRRAGLGLSLLAWLVGVPLAHGVVPWLISWLTPRYGWSEAGAGVWNWLGVIPIAVGAALLVWVMATHFRRSSELPQEVELDWKPKVFLARGPYALSRNPMYVAELALWLGWAQLFGSPAVLAGALVLAVLMNRVIRREEAALAAEFGDEYRVYRAAVPRWLGASTRTE